MTIANADQQGFWSSASGLKWIEHEAALDATFSQVTATVLRAADVGAGQRVLDIGCGTGETSLQLARQVGADGHVTALDISAPLLRRAEDRARAAGLRNITFREDDAQTARFDDRFDVVVSRFGVMFFADSVAAFRNIRSALRPGGHLAMICWDKLAVNPWFNIPAGHAVARLGKPAKLPPRTPGPMAFAETDYVTDILHQAGWSGISAQPTDLALTPPGGVTGAAELASRVGMAIRVMNERGGTEEDMAAIISQTRDSFTAFDGPDGVQVPARVNLYQAQV